MVDGEKNGCSRKTATAAAAFFFVVMVFSGFASAEPSYQNMSDVYQNFSFIGNNLMFQVRTGNDPGFPGISFVGPDNTSNTWFWENQTTNNLYGLLNTGRYFQYNAFLYRNDSIGQTWSPNLYNVTVSFINSTETDVPSIASPIYSFTTLNCTTIGYSPTNSTVAITFSWYINGVFNSSSTSVFSVNTVASAALSPPANGFVAGDVWNCSVNASDGSTSSPALSTNVSITAYAANTYALISQVYTDFSWYGGNTWTQVKSCSQPDCSDAAFLGPDNSSNTWFDSSPANLTTTNVSVNRYFQFKEFLYRSDSLNQSWSPNLYNATAYAETNSSSLTVSLGNPLNASWSASRSVNFTFTPVDNASFLYCNLSLFYLNATSLANVSNQSGVANNSVNGINYSFAVDGSYSWSVACSDVFQTNSSAVNNTVFVDATPPSGVAYVNPTPLNGSYRNVNWSVVNASFVESNPAACLLDFVYANSTEKNLTMNLVSGSTPYCWLNVTGLPEGQTNFTVFVNDSAGNSGSNSSYYRFFVDVHAPTASLTTPLNNEWNANPVNFTATASDNLGLKNATLTVWNETGVINQTTTNYSSAGVLTATVSAVFQLGVGVYNWSCQAFDYAGNSGSSQTFTVTTDEPRPLNMRLEQVNVSTALFSWENRPNSVWTSLRVGNNLVDIRQTYATYDNWTVNIYPDQQYDFSWQVGDNITAQGGEHGFSFRTLSWNPALTSYLHRRLVTIDHSLVGSDKENYGLNLSLTDENFVYAGSWGALHPAFTLLNYSNHNDIRFTDYADVRVLPFSVSLWSVPGEGGQHVQGPPDEHAVTGNISDASNMWDGDWSSFSVPNPSGTYYYNYSVPAGAKNSSKFRLYDGDWNWYDIAPPADCFGGSKLRFKSDIDYNGPSITTYCQNNSDDTWILMQVTASQYFYESQMTWVFTAQANIIVMPTHFNDLTQNQSYGVDGDYDTKLWMYYGNVNDVSNESVLSYDGLVNASFYSLGTQVDKPVGAPVISSVNDSVGRTATGTNVSWTVDQSVDNRVLLASNPWFMNAFWATTLTNVTESFTHLYAKANQTVLLVVHSPDFLGLLNVSCSNSSYNGNYSLNASASPVEITFLNVNSSEYLDWSVSYSENKSWARNTKLPAFQIMNLTPDSLYYYKLYSYGATANSTYVGNFTLGTPPAVPQLRFVNYSADRPNDAVTVCAEITDMNGNPSVQASFQYFNNDSDSGFNETAAVTVNSVGVYCQVVSGLAFGHVYYFRGKAVGTTTGYSDASSHDFFAVQEFFAGDPSNPEGVARDIQYCPPNPDGTANVGGTCFTERGYLPGTLRQTNFIYIESNVTAAPLTVSWFAGSSWADHAMSSSAYGFQYLTLNNLGSAWQTFYVKNSTGNVVLNWTKPSTIHLNGESRRDESALVAFGGTPTAIDYAVFYPRIPYYNSTSYEWCQAAPGGDLYKCMGVQFWGGGGLAPDLAGTAFDRAQLQRSQVLDGEWSDTAYLEPTLDSGRPTSTFDSNASQQRFCFAFLALWWNNPIVPASNITNYYVHYWQQDEWWSSYLGRAQDRLFDQEYLFYWEYDANQYVRNWKPFSNSILYSQNVVKRISNDTFNAPYNESLVADFKGGFNVDTSNDALYNLGFYTHGRWPNFQVGKHQQMFLIFNLPASLTACENTTATLNCTVPANGCDEATDSDADGLTDCKELWVYHTNPKMNDTNEVGRTDGWLVAHGYDVNDPSQFDTPPSVSGWTITGASNFSGNASSNDVELNPGVPYVFSVNASDSDGDAFSYDWRFDGNFVSAGENASITVPDSALHNVTLNLTDSFNESSILLFRITSNDSISPVPSLGTNPADGFVSGSHDVVFEFSCTDNLNVSTIELWADFNGSWAVNYSDSSYSNGSILSVAVNGIPEGSFVWGVYCNDSAGNAAWSVNRSLTVSLYVPPGGIGGGSGSPSCGPCVRDGVCQSCCGTRDSDCVAQTPYPTLAPTPFPSIRVSSTPKPTVEPSPSIEPTDSIWTQFPSTKEGASQAISTIQDLIRIAESQNKDVREAGRLLDSAREAFARGDYAAAADYANRAQELLARQGVVKKTGFAAEFDWLTALIAVSAVVSIGAVIWFYSRKRAGK